MRTKKGFNLRNICGEDVIVAEGKENIDFTNIISMNASAAYLWRKIQDSDFDAATLARLLVEEYEIDETEALKDSEDVMRQWLEAGIIE